MRFVLDPIAGRVEPFHADAALNRVINFLDHINHVDVKVRARQAEHQNVEVDVHLRKVIRVDAAAC
jgi:ribosome-associated translation inhibitor RaiA